MKLLPLLLHQVTKSYQADTNQTTLINAIRNPSDIQADKIIIPFLSNGITLGIDRSDHYLVDHYIHVPLKMEIVSPISLYLKNMNDLPPDLSRFCDIPENHQVKYLQSHINTINAIWSEEIQSYESLMFSGKQKRAVVQGVLTLILLTYHVSKFFTAKHDKDQYQTTINDLTSKISSMSNTNKLILMATEDILDLQQRYFCSASKKFAKVQEDLAKQLVKDYIRQARLTIENAINNRLPLTTDVNREITSLCEALNDQNAHLCSTMILRGMSNSFRGLSTSTDDFGSAIIHIHTILEIPIFSQNQFVSRLSIGNIGFYIGDKRKKLSLPDHAYITNFTDPNLPPNTPMTVDCNHFGCSPISQINNLQPHHCLGAIISLNSSLISQHCHLLDMPDTCVGLHLRSNSFMVSGRGIYTPSDTKLPKTIKGPTIVPMGQLVCPGKVVNFYDYNQNEKFISLNFELEFQNFTSYEGNHDPMEILYQNISSLSLQLSNLSDSQNLSSQIYNLEEISENRFLVSIGISLLGIILTVLASVFKIQRVKNFLCNSKNKRSNKIVTFADPELMVPLKFDSRVKSTPNLSKA